MLEIRPALRLLPQRPRGRSELLHTREHSESVGLLRAESATEHALQGRMEVIKRVEYELMHVSKVRDCAVPFSTGAK